MTKETSLKKLLIISLLLLLTACSSKFAYNNLDWLIYWYLDDYVELEGSEKKAFDSDLNRWLSWHRKEELLEYKSHLLELKHQLNERPISEKQWQAHMDRGRTHWTRLRDYIAPELMPYAQRLTDKQVESLFNELNQSIQESIEERQNLKPDEMLKERYEEAREELKGYIGELTLEQMDLVKQTIPQYKTNFDNWIQYRRNILSEAKSLFDQRNQLENFQIRLLNLLKYPEDYYPQQYGLIRDYNRQVTVALLTALSATLTDKQLARLNRKIDDLLEDINDLNNS
jgi:hypothetical protein